MDAIDQNVKPENDAKAAEPEKVPQQKAAETENAVKAAAPAPEQPVQPEPEKAAESGPEQKLSLTQEYNLDMFDAMNKRDEQRAKEAERGEGGGKKTNRKSRREKKAEKKKALKTEKNASGGQTRPAGSAKAPAEGAAKPRKTQGQNLPAEQKQVRKQRVQEPSRPQKDVSAPAEPVQDLAVVEQKRRTNYPKDPLPKKKKQGPKSPEEHKRLSKRRKMIMIFGGSFAAIVILWILCLTVFFRIDTIEIKGASRYSAEEIREVCGVTSGQNLFTLNEGKVENNIETQLPYVNSVTISRHLPSKIVIEVTDVIVVGAEKVGDEYIVVGANGKVLEKVSELPKNCAELIGAELTSTEPGSLTAFADETKQEIVEEFAKAGSEGLVRDLTEIDVSDIYNLKATYDGRIVIKFGSDIDMDYKFRFLKTVLDSGEIKASDKGTLDLSMAHDLDKVYFSPDYSIDTGTTGSEDSSSSESGEESSEDSDTVSEDGTSEDSGMTDAGDSGYYDDGTTDTGE